MREEEKIEEEKVEEGYMKDQELLSISLAIWGGTHLTLLTKTQLDLILDLQVECLIDTQVGNITDTVKILPDWILDVSISPFEPASCALVTVHNALFRVNLLGRRKANNSEIELESLSSPSNLIHYSANLIWESCSKILVASGTVFGDVFAWEYNSNDEMCQLLCKFKGHEGSIYGVDISPVVTQPGSGRVGRLLASCSDDRTIRVWDLNTSDNVTKTPMNKCSLHEDSTGFGSDENDVTASNNIGLIAIAMGHASRIWRVRFLCSEPDVGGNRLINIISSGEDATTQQWNLRIPSHLSGQASKENSFVRFLHTSNTLELAHCKTYKFHSGKHIWSTVLGQFNGNYIISTGGADGRISLYEIDVIGKQVSPKEKKKKQRTTTHTIYFDNLSGKLQLQNLAENSTSPTFSHDDGSIIDRNQKYFVPKDSFNRYTFVSETEVLLTTTMGRVFRGSINELPTWTEVHLPDLICQNLRSYAIMVSFTEFGIAYIAGAHGAIYTYDCNNHIVQLIGNVEGKVADMFGLYGQDNKIYALLVATLHKKTATIFYLEHSSLETSNSVVIDLPEDFVIKSAGIVSDLLICGSRSGFLAIFEPQRSSMPLEVYNGIDESKGDAITAIVPLRFFAGFSLNYNYFVATSRNGNYSIYSVSRLEPDVELSSLVHIRHQSSVPTGLTVEHAWFQGEDLFMYGFRGNSFVVWNESKQIEAMEFECGGAHRSYAYISLKDDKGGYFICTKASKLVFFVQNSLSHKVMTTGAHGREIKACAISGDDELIATGAEDTLIRIWKKDYDGKEKCGIQPLTIIRKHTTGIQHLQWIGSTHLCSSGGNNEFFIWAIHRIPYFGPGVVCEASFSNQKMKTGLRITCFDITCPIGSWNKKYSCHITLGYSDSSFHIYLYSPQLGLILAAAGKYTSSCITQIRNPFYCQILQIFTAATDGNLVLWSAHYPEILDTNFPDPVDFRLLSAQKVHQNTIKSLDVNTINNTNIIVVATGGDDGALGISIYTLHNYYPGTGENPNIYLPFVSLLPAAHAAAITGLSFPRPHRSFFPDGFDLVTTSTDQKLKLWKIRISEKIVDSDFMSKSYSAAIDLQKCSFTSVSDAANLAAAELHSDYIDTTVQIMVVGNGLEIFALNLK